MGEVSNDPSVGGTFNAALLPYDLTRSGTLFNFFGHTDVKELALYAQDQIKAGAWVFNLGLAYFYSGLDTRDSASKPNPKSASQTYAPVALDHQPVDLEFRKRRWSVPSAMCRIPRWNRFENCSSASQVCRPEGKEEDVSPEGVWLSPAHKATAAGCASGLRRVGEDFPPLTTVVYYTAVQRDLGDANVDRFLKLFMVPGMGHCGGGDGFSQLETLTPLMAWVEQGKAPIMLEGDKVQGGRGPTQLPCRRSTPVNATVPDKLKRLIHAVFRLFAISGSDPLIFSFFPTQICPLDQLP